MAIPTREEWKQMVATHGYRNAVAMLDCDLDDVPGIEETWSKYFETIRPEYERSAREVWDALKDKGR